MTRRIFIASDSPRLQIDWPVKEKRESSYLLLVPLVEAFALPGLIERATGAEASRKYDIYPPSATQKRHIEEDITYPHKPSTVATFLTNPEICEVSTSQEAAHSKRLSLCLQSKMPCDYRIPPSEPDRASAKTVYARKYTNFYSLTT